jgi:hypothetical protein
MKLKVKVKVTAPIESRDQVPPRFAPPRPTHPSGRPFVIYSMPSGLGAAPVICNVIRDTGLPAGAETIGAVRG